MTAPGQDWFHTRLGERAFTLLGTAYEELIMRVAERLIRRGDMVVDGGCNAGLHTMRFAHLAGPEGLVLAVDPVAEALAQNRAWFEGTGGQGGVRWCQVALAAAPGEAMFHHARAENSMSSLRYRREELDTVEIRVTLARLDDLLPTERASFIKLDCEGAEFDALLGAEALLRRSQCPVVFECGRAWAAKVFAHSEERFFGFFTALGYALRDGFGRPFGPAQWLEDDAGWYFWAWPRDWPREAEILALFDGFWAERRAAITG